MERVDGPVYVIEGPVACTFEGVQAPLQLLYSLQQFLVADTQLFYFCLQRNLSRASPVAGRRLGHCRAPSLKHESKAGAAKRTLVRAVLFSPER